MFYFKPKPTPMVKFPAIREGVLCIMNGHTYNESMIKNVASIIAYDGVNEFEVKFNCGRNEKFDINTLPLYPKAQFYTFGRDIIPIGFRKHKVKMLNKFMYIYDPSIAKKYIISSRIVEEIDDVIYSGDDKYWAHIRFKSKNVCNYCVEYGIDDVQKFLVGADGSKHDISPSLEFYCQEGKLTNFKVISTYIMDNGVFLVQASNKLFYGFLEYGSSIKSSDNSVKAFEIYASDNVAILCYNNNIIDCSGWVVNTKLDYEIDAIDTIDTIDTDSRLNCEHRFYPVIVDHNIFAINDFGVVCSIGIGNPRIYPELSNVVELRQNKNKLSIITGTESFYEIDDVTKLRCKELPITYFNIGHNMTILYWVDKYRQILKNYDGAVYSIGDDYCSGFCKKITPIGFFPIPLVHIVLVTRINKYGEYGYEINNIPILGLPDIVDIEYVYDFGIYNVIITTKSGGAKKCCLISSMEEDYSIVFEDGSHFALIPKNGQYYSPLGKYEEVPTCEVKHLNVGIYNIGGDIVVFPKLSSSITSIKIFHIFRYYLAISEVGGYNIFGKTIINHIQTKSKGALKSFAN